jgi:hypothetical protein
MLPRHTREAMLKGIEQNRIIVGAYVDKRGGVCPMLAAHRNGGRTSFAGFARAWDAFTGAKKRKARRASLREIRTLKGYLELSLLRDELGGSSMAELAGEIRRKRAASTPKRIARRTRSRLGRRPATEEIKVSRRSPAPRPAGGPSAPAPRSSVRS